VNFGSNHVKYTYDASGVKLRKEVKNGSNLTYTDYVGGIQYTKADTCTWILDFVQTAEGRVMGDGTYVYDLCECMPLAKDHLGNVRASIDQSGVRQSDDYYPFGMTFGMAMNQTAGANKYLYNGKELQNELGLDWYDYGWRQYDPQIGRFTTIDPWAERYSNQSPYLYAYNNPIRYTDFLGLGADDEVDKYREKHAGKTYRNSNTSYKYTYNGENSHTVTETKRNQVTTYSEDGSTYTITNTETTTSQTFNFNSDGTMEATSTIQSVKTVENTFEVTSEMTKEGSVVAFNKIGETKNNTLGIDGQRNVNLSGGRYASLNEHIGAVQGQLREFGTGSNLFQGSDKVDKSKSLWTNIGLTATSIAATFINKPIVKNTGVIGLGVGTGLVIVDTVKHYHDFSGASSRIKIKRD
jgi:RHS repeat-associated protein